MEIIISNVIVGVLIIIAYTLGLNNGKVNNNARSIIKAVKNPIKTIKESKEQKEQRLIQEEEDRKLLIAINNIEKYDGSGLGQEEVK